MRKFSAKIQQSVYEKKEIIKNIHNLPLVLSKVIKLQSVNI